MKLYSGNTKKSVYTSLMCSVLAVCAQLSLPLPSGIPLTFQSFAASLCGFILGKKYGVICCSIYLLLGICGAPVFSGFSGGITRLIGVSGGFLYGLYFTVLLAGFSASKGKAVCFSNSVIAVVLCHLCGIIHFSILTKITVLSAFFTVSAPFILKDILSFIFAYILSEKIKKRCL